MRRRSYSLVPALAAVFVTSVGAGCSGSVATEERDPLDVFLIVVDTLRADILSSYGGDEISTPNIDRLAAMGTRFDRAQAAASWTRPSMASVLTSKYPGQLGLLEAPVAKGAVLEWRDPRHHESNAIPAATPTLAERLEEAGYATAGFVNQPALNLGNGFERGFGDWFYPAAEDRVEKLTDEAPQQDWASTLHALESDAALVKQFDSWLSRRPVGRPAFTWLHLLNPHLPYHPPQKYAPRPRPDGRPAFARVRYAAEVRATDDMIGDVLAAIETQAELERSVIVFLSDHGEAFRERDGMFEHGHTLHREVLRVPLIVVAPGFDPARVVTSHVRHIDVMPTILELAGLEPGEELEGSSLVPLLRGESLELPVFAHGMLYGSTERSLIADGYKLMYDEQPPHLKLFDVVRDPDETADVSEESSERVRPMLRRLQAWQESTEADWAQLGASGEERSGDRQREARALQALGYVTSGDGADEP